MSEASRNSGGLDMISDSETRYGHDQAFHVGDTPEAAVDTRPSPRPRIVLLAAGVLIGFAVGWLAFSSPWSEAGQSTVLFDEELVTSLVERARPAVVEINVRESRFSRGTGSGFLVDDQGHIVTNHHVVAAGGDVTLQLSDGTTVAATRLGASPADDLALLEVDPELVSHITPLPLGDSDTIQAGQMAIAIGSSFDLQNSVTVGVVSGTGRSETGILRRPIPELVQTDAALNPGNSGGPLINSDGEVIGVASSVEVDSSTLTQVGVGFAIPSNSVRDLLPRLVEAGEFKRPWIGISGGDLTKDLAETLAGVSVDRGIYISQVVRGSPAHLAGLRADPTRRGTGDIITGIDGRPMATMSEMVSYFNTLWPGARVTLAVVRGDRTVNVPITLAPWPDMFSSR